MTIPPTVSAPLCSELSAARGLPLVGTAGCYEHVLAFELDPPWTARVAGSRSSDARLDGALERLGGRREVRLLAIEPRTEAAALDDRSDGEPALVRVLHAVRTGMPCRGYDRVDYLVRRDELPDLLEALASGREASGVRAASAAGRRDLLVCTHGARDACCGKFGFRLYQHLARLAEARDGHGLRVWRCSHLGGHRFAPTLLDLPSGRTFGRVGTDDARAILEGGAALVVRLREIYRGRCALPEPAQILERELWLRSGDAFDRASLRWSVAQHRDGGWDVELVAECEGISPDRWRARVDLDEVDAVSTPASCGRDPEPEAPWRIVG